MATSATDAVQITNRCAEPRPPARAPCLCGGSTTRNMVPGARNYRDGNKLSRVHGLLSQRREAGEVCTSCDVETLSALKFPERHHATFRRHGGHGRTCRRLDLINRPEANMTAWRWREHSCRAHR